MSQIETLLHSNDVDEVVEACEVLAGPDIREIDRALPQALRGKSQAVARYVGASRRILRRFLSDLHTLQPDLVVQQGSSFVVVDVKSQPATFSLALLELGALEAPFSVWVTSFGAGRGTTLSLVDRFRAIVGSLRPLTPSSSCAVLPHWENLSAESFNRFRFLAEQALQQESLPIQSLARVKQLFGLNLTELGRLFGTTRQAVTDWLENGVPAHRQVKLLTVVRIAELLERKLRPGALPAIARKPAPAFEGLSILEVIQEDRHDELLARVKQSFDWATTA